MEKWTQIQKFLNLTRQKESALKQPFNSLPQEEKKRGTNRKDINKGAQSEENKSYWMTSCTTGNPIPFRSPILPFELLLPGSKLYSIDDYSFSRGDENGREVYGVLEWPKKGEGEKGCSAVPKDARRSSYYMYTHPGIWRIDPWNKNGPFRMLYLLHRTSSRSHSIPHTHTTALLLWHYYVLQHLFCDKVTWELIRLSIPSYVR